MSEFVRKGALGGYKPAPGGHSDPDCTYVILPKEEYALLLREKAQAELGKRNAELEAERMVRKRRRRPSGGSEPPRRKRGKE